MIVTIFEMQKERQLQFERKNEEENEFEIARKLRTSEHCGSGESG